MPTETRSRLRTPFAPALDLPPPYRLVSLREVGDAFAHATGIAAEQGGDAGPYRALDLVEFAVVLEPEERWTARRAFTGTLHAPTNSPCAPPEAIAFDWPPASALTAHRCRRRASRLAAGCRRT